MPFICGSSLNLALISTPLACTLAISPSFTFAAAANDAEPISSFTSLLKFDPSTSSIKNTTLPSKLSGSFSGASSPSVLNSPCAPSAKTTFLPSICKNSNIFFASACAKKELSITIFSHSSKNSAICSNSSSPTLHSPLRYPSSSPSKYSRVCLSNLDASSEYLQSNAST